MSLVSIFLFVLVLPDLGMIRASQYKFGNYSSFFILGNRLRDFFGSFKSGKNLLNFPNLVSSVVGYLIIYSIFKLLPFPFPL